MTILGAVIIAALVGLLAKWLLDRSDSEWEITWTEYGLTLAVILVLLAPLTSWIGWKMAQSNRVTYNEYWNGWETGTNWEVINCTRDGSCRWSYSCDSYPCNPHDCNCTCTSRDKNGSCTSQSCQTCYDTCWHDCPYCQQEWTFTVQTTLGDYTYAANVFPPNPDRMRWREGERIPDHVIRQAGTGVPKDWQQARDRIAANNPGPVTARRQYANYIIPADFSILRNRSTDVQSYQQLKLLPSPSRDVFSYYLADKVYFVGFFPANSRQWEEKLMYFDGALGNELQGDLHLVITRNEVIAGNPDRYTNALAAYWSDWHVFGPNAISKNAIIVVLGTEDGRTVSWARATTGMPKGNEGLLMAIMDGLKGRPLDPDTVIGEVRRDRSQRLALHGNGILENLVFGLKDPSTKFSRVHMSGFAYLKNEIQPLPSQQHVIYFITVLLSCLAWLVGVFHGTRSGRSYRNRSYPF